MSSIRNKYFDLSIPDDWTDRSVLVWSAPPGSGTMPPNVAVAFDALQPGEPLVAYVNRQVDSLKASLADWQLISQVQSNLKGRDSYEMVFTWSTPPGKMRQRQIYCPLSGQQVASIACTASDPEFADFDRAYFQKVLGSIVFRG
ncbi:DcrB-related protein [Roseibium sp.]|uniref:DcrB-related protein n=1 Tax=Roseibium sp. TaxID=1936156 RepID=UPI003BB1ADE6